MNKQQLSSLKRQLLAEKDSFEQHLRKNSESGMSMNDSIGELSGNDNHPADLGTEMFEREKEMSFNKFDQIKLLEIKDALERIDSGNYGKCSSCKKEIPFARLQSVPTTLYCITHANVEKDTVYKDDELYLSSDEDSVEFDENFYDEFVEMGEDDVYNQIKKYGEIDPSQFY